MRKTNRIRNRCHDLREVTGAKECVWMCNEGYYTYRLFFQDEQTALSAKDVVLNNFTNTWVEYIGNVEMECEDEFIDSYMVDGATLEVMFLD